MTAERIITPFEHSLLMELRSVVYDALTAEMSKRRGREDWVECERAAMVAAANTWTANGHAGRHISVEEVEAIEHWAMGHSDYASKMALYVARMAMDLPGPRL